MKMCQCKAGCQQNDRSGKNKMDSFFLDTFPYKQDNKEQDNKNSGKRQFGIKGIEQKKKKKQRIAILIFYF